MTPLLPDQFLLATTAAGLAGFDPATFLIALGALGAGMRRRSILMFTAVVVLGTAAWGLLLSGLLGPRVRDVHWVHLARSGDVAACVEVALAAVVLGWGIRRLLRHRRDTQGPGNTERPEADPPARRGLFVIALGFVAVVAGDPAFDVQVVQGGRVPLPLDAAGWLLWSVLSQGPLVLLALAVAARRHRALAAAMRNAWLRIQPVAGKLATALILAAGLLLAVDGLDRLLTGQFLWNP